MEDAPVVNFHTEAEQILKEVQYAVKEGLMCTGLPSSSECAYFNITTQEEKKLTIRLTMKGFEVVGFTYDNIELESNDKLECFETVYALLNHISPSYQQTFNHAVSHKLEELRAEDKAES